MFTARILLTVVIAALTLTAPASAGAATYNAWSCASPTGAPVSASDWQPTRNAPIATLGSTCGSVTGALEATAYAAESNPWVSAGGGWETHAPPGTRITSLDVWWANQVNPVSVPPFGRVQVYANGDSAYHRDDSAFGQASVPLGAANHQRFAGLDASSLALIAWCHSYCTQSYQRVTATYAMYRAQVTVSDTSPPTGTVSGLDQAHVAAPLPLMADVRDVGGGVQAVEVRVDGRLAARHAPAGACSDLTPTTPDLDYTRLQPCPTHYQLPLALTPDLFPDADPHTITVTAIDAAGQATELLSKRVAVAPTAGFWDARRGFHNPDLNPDTNRAVNGANGGPARMTLALANRIVRFDQQPRILGRLTTLTGNAPIVGARVWLAVYGENGWALAGRPLITNTRGVVSARLPARQGSRALQLVYFPYTDLSGHGLTPVRRVKVRASAVLKASRRMVPVGGRVLLTARLRVRVPRGRSVLGTLQTLVDGQWRTFRQLRFHPGARTLRTAVRFRHSAPGTVYPMRIRVPAQTGMRYTTGGSRVVTVTLR